MSRDKITPRRFIDSAAIGGTLGFMAVATLANLFPTPQQKNLEQLALQTERTPKTQETRQEETPVHQQEVFGDETSRPQTKQITIRPEPQTIQPKIFRGEIPVYSLATVPANYCARYARLSAKELFGKTYTPNNAWDMKYDETIVASMEENNWTTSTRELIESGKIKPGMLAGISYPRSRYLGKKDKMGNTIECTHVAVYLGINRKGEPMFAEEWGKRAQKTSLSEFVEKGMRITEFIDAEGE